MLTQQFREIGALTCRSSTRGRRRRRPSPASPALRQPPTSSALSLRFVLLVLHPRDHRFLLLLSPPSLSPLPLPPPPLRPLSHHHRTMNVRGESPDDSPGMAPAPEASPSTVVLSPDGPLRHRPRQRSQGYFEPSLPSNSPALRPAMPPSNVLSASQLAAQAAMHVQGAQHARKRSTTVPEPAAAPPAARPPVSPPSMPPGGSTITFRTNGMTYQNRAGATTAANLAFPRSPQYSPGQAPPPLEHASPKTASAPTPEMPPPPKPPKEKSKMKLFSKPKNIGITKDRDVDRKFPALPSPGKMGSAGMHSTQTLNRIVMANQSTTSLAESNVGAVSLYSSANPSTSTLVPASRGEERDKEKHKHHFLSRPKKKDKDDLHLALSSASSNSRVADPSGPTPLYSFAAPSSPGPTSAFATSVTGLDLRHGGRQLRHKKREEKEKEKAAAAACYVDALEPPLRERNHSFSLERTDWTGTTTLAATPGAASFSYPADNMASLGQSFGLPGLAPDDAWPLLKARLLHVFEGEELRPAD